VGASVAAIVGGSVAATVGAVVGTDVAAVPQAASTIERTAMTDRNSSGARFMEFLLL
jgi:hypothetical protein